MNWSKVGSTVLISVIALIGLIVLLENCAKGAWGPNGSVTWQRLTELTPADSLYCVVDTELEFAWYGEVSVPGEGLRGHIRFKLFGAARDSVRVIRNGTIVGAYPIRRVEVPTP